MSGEMYAWLQGESPPANTENRDYTDIARRLASSFRPGDNLREAYDQRDDSRRRLSDKMVAILTELLQRLDRAGISATLVLDDAEFAREIIGNWVIPKEHGDSVGISLRFDHDIPATGRVLGTQAKEPGSEVDLHSDPALMVK